MHPLKKSTKLDNVCYDIRGPVLDEAKRLEDTGEKILKLNIGNPAPFGFKAPDEVVAQIATNLAKAEGYIDSKGLIEAREAVAIYSAKKGIGKIDVENIFIGNGVSELIVMAMQGLLNNGDEILIPAPDYPLWTAGVVLAGGKPVHYICDEDSSWYPDISDIKKKISQRTKGIVVINPNNPTGAVYPKELLNSIVELAANHGLIIYSDEIYDRILYDGACHTSIASLTNDILCVTLNGLSKSHLITGYRVGWMTFSGNLSVAENYLEGVNMLASMRLCSNVPAQYAIPIALDKDNLIRSHTAQGGRLKTQRDFGYERINRIPGLSCTKPQGTFYFFPRIDTKKFQIKDDEKFAFDLLKRENVLVVQGTGFNWFHPDHFRIVFLPDMQTLERAFDAIENFLKNYVQENRK
ncbi:MAG TPA: pyridoxal phosphate-dependent aminotransferase [Candidatus Acidoferrales bacterium]|nr:pyridoxal phosphate-dependent aminotransferase [Candidatus Acidoferrales bacterium]